MGYEYILNADFIYVSTIYNQTESHIVINTENAIKYLKIILVYPTYRSSVPVEFLSAEPVAVVVVLVPSVGTSAGNDLGSCVLEDTVPRSVSVARKRN
jgi:hypothetical protein